MRLVHLAGIAAGAWLMNRRNTGAIGAIVPDKCVGVTQCADGTWSTLPADRRGVCTHHGGIAEGYRRRVVKEETGEVVDVIEVVDQAGQTDEVVEVPVIGYYRFTTYTTKKGKTAPAIAIKFNRKPQPEVLEVLRSSKFWWNRADGQWYGWETPGNLEVVESLPVAMAGERAPVVTVEEVEEVKQTVQPSEKPKALQNKEGKKPKTAFRIEPPARGRLYSNAEYADLKVKLSAQAIRAKRQLNQAFPEIKKLWQEIEAFDNWGLKNFPKWPSIFSDQPGYYGGARGSYVPDITQRSHDHPAGILQHYVLIAYDRFRNAYGLGDERFNEYRNRNYEAVQKFFTERLTEATIAVREKIKLLKDPFWFSEDADPQEKIDRGARKLSTNLLGRILQIVHKINPDEHWVRNLEFNGQRFQKYKVLDGTIRLKDYLDAIERRKEESQQQSDESARKLKRDMAVLWEFNKTYLEKGYSFHLPTYSRKLKEAGVGRISNKMLYGGRRAKESYIEVNRMDPEGGYRLMLSVVPGYEVESILISTALLNECFKGRTDQKGIIFGCYSREKVYPDVLKYIESEEPIHLLYGLEPAISGYNYLPPWPQYRTASFFI